MWRKKVDKSIKPYLEKFIEETHRHKSSFEEAEDPSKAQLWIAIALLSKHLFNLEIKLNYIERALKDMGEKKESEKLLLDIEKQVKEKKGEKEREVAIEVKKEAEALGEGAKLFSEIAKKKVKKKSRKKK